MNSYELYLKNCFTEKELKKQQKIKNQIDLINSDKFNCLKFYSFLIGIIFIGASLFMSVNIFAVSKNVRMLDILLSLPVNIFVFGGIISSFCFLISISFEWIIKKKIKIKKNKEKEIDDIIKKADFLPFLQNTIEKYFNFDIQANFIKDFNNIGEVGESNIISFIKGYYDKKDSTHFHTFSKEVCYQGEWYTFKTEKDWLNNKHILIKLLALINLNKLKEEKEKKLLKELKEKYNQLKDEKEKEDFLKKFKN